MSHPRVLQVCYSSSTTTIHLQDRHCSTSNFSTVAVRETPGFRLLFAILLHVISVHTIEAQSTHMQRRDPFERGWGKSYTTPDAVRQINDVDNLLTAVQGSRLFAAERGAAAAVNVQVGWYLSWLRLVLFCHIPENTLLPFVMPAGQNSCRPHASKPSVL
jgi:hypothetical protein